MGQAKKINKSVLPRPVLSTSSVSTESTQILNKDRVSINLPEDHTTNEEVFIEDIDPQDIKTVKPVSVTHPTTQKRYVSTNTPSIPSTIGIDKSPS